jgi:hypothetical protein
MFSYLGFEWDLEKKTVTIGKEKCMKYLLRLQPWVPGSRFTKTEAQQLIGTLNHCSVVLVGRQSHLPTLYQFVSTFNNAKNVFVTHSVTRSVITDVSWWRSELTKPWCGAHICQVPPTLRSQIFVDASTSWGIGFVWEDHWLTWKLLPGWKAEGCDIGWAEMVAVELAFLTLLAARYSNCHIILCSDNQGVIGALKNEASHNPQQNAVLHRIIHYTQSSGIWLTPMWIASEENITDGPSWGIFPTTPHYPYIPKLAFKLRPFISLAL